MQTRPALLLVLVLALLATGCANRPNLSSGITTETVLSLPPDLEVPAGDTALLYPLSASPEGAKAQVEALVGQPLGEGEPGVSGTLYSLGQATVTISPECSGMLETQAINGRRYLLVPMDGTVEVNGFALEGTGGEGE